MPSLSEHHQYVSEQIAHNRIEALIDDANTASKNLLLKLGFTYEGNLRERFLIGDMMKDECYFGMLQREWQNRP